MTKFDFDWSEFTEKDLSFFNEKNRKNLPEKMTCGYCYGETDKGKVIIVIRHEYFSCKNKGFALEIFKANDEWGISTWLGSCCEIHSATNYKRFCKRVENLFTKYYYDRIGKNSIPLYT